MSVLFKKEGHVAYITLNRPEAMNSLDPESIDELTRGLATVKSDPDIRVAVLSGAGGKAFCTGADLKKTMPPSTSFVSTYFDQEALMRAFDMWKPLICAIDGYALGGGLELALACDLRIASDVSTFGLPEVKVGSMPGAEGTQRIIRTLPRAIAMKMLLTGDRIDAETALRYGLISDVYPQDKLMSAAKEMAEKIAGDVIGGSAPLSVKAIKQAVVLGGEIPFKQASVLEQLLCGIMRDSEDRIEGRKAFAEKRVPEFKGR